MPVECWPADGALRGLLVLRPGIRGLRPAASAAPRGVCESVSAGSIFVRVRESNCGGNVPPVLNRFCPDRDAAASLGLAMLDLQAIALLLPPCCIFTTAAFPKLRRTARAMVCVGWLALLVGLLIVLEKYVLPFG